MVWAWSTHTQCCMALHRQGCRSTSFRSPYRINNGRPWSRAPLAPVHVRLLHLLTTAIGTTRTQADPVARPLSARADIRAQTATSGGDPSRTWTAQDFRSAKALFVPSLYRGIVLSIAW